MRSSITNGCLLPLTTAAHRRYGKENQPPQAAFGNIRVGCGIIITVNMSVRIHPAFWAAAAVMCLTGNLPALAAALAIVLIHELAHAGAAYERGFVMNKITLMPYGAVLSGEENIPEKDAFLIAAAGPLSNAAICLILWAVWWRFPAVYPYTKVLFDVSFAIGVFNILPFYPLDGARMLLAVSKNKLRALKILKIFGVAGSFLMLAWFAASAFHSLNLAPAIMAVPLFLGAVGGTEKERYRHIYECISEGKVKNAPLENKTDTVYWGLKLRTLLKRLNRNCLRSFVVVDDDMKTVKKLSEKDFLKLLERNSVSATLKEALEFSDAPRPK